MSSSGSRPLNRVIYVALLISFLGLTATGLPLKYSSQRWAQVFVQGFGGFEYTSVWHHVFGTIALLCCVAHVVLRFRSTRKCVRQRDVKWRAILFGPDSLSRSLRDAKDMVGMARWFCRTRAQAEI